MHKLRLVLLVGLVTFSLLMSGCITGLNSTNLNTKLNEVEATDDSMAKLEAQGCGIEQLNLTKITKIANQQYAEYTCETKAGTKIKVYKMNGQWLILGE